MVSTIRYIITPDNRAYITDLSSGRKIVVSAAFFRKIARLHPRAVLGSATVTAAELDAIGFRPVRKEVTADDARISVVS